MTSCRFLWRHSYYLATTTSVATALYIAIVAKKWCPKIKAENYNKRYYKISFGGCKWPCTAFDKGGGTFDVCVWGVTSFSQRSLDLISACNQTDIWYETAKFIPPRLFSPSIDLFIFLTLPLRKWDQAVLPAQMRISFERLNAVAHITVIVRTLVVIWMFGASMSKFNFLKIVKAL